MPRASLEFLSAVVRYWADGQYGDPYDWCATVRWVDPTTVEILGITSPPTPAVWRAVKEELGRFGVTTITYYRIKNGVKRKKELSIAN